jgi:hypothetical protein
MSAKIAGYDGMTVLETLELLFPVGMSTSASVDEQQRDAAGSELLIKDPGSRHREIVHAASVLNLTHMRFEPASIGKAVPVT